MHTTKSLQAACEKIARLADKDARVTITAGFSHGERMLYVAVNARYRNDLVNAADFDDALAKAAGIVDAWAGKVNAGEMEYASWPVERLAAE